MLPKIPKKPQTEGAPDFDAGELFSSWSSGRIGVPKDNDFAQCITDAFHLRLTDKYTYRAIAEVTLAQAQTYLNYGDQGKLLEWYRDESGAKIDGPPDNDITAYTAIFSSTTSTAKALTALSANARKGSLRAGIAAHLSSLYQPFGTTPKLKTAHVNPYYDLWSWSCHPLRWGGPNADTSQIRISHALLPVFYHHFGCIVPTFEALHIIRTLAKGRTVVDLGSGNGYWTYLLRRLDHGNSVTVIPIDNGHSEWRTVWIGDTIATDGIKWISSNGADKVLLMVYPQVSDDFTGKVVRAYKGDTIIVAGTQNSNGFTAFATETIDKWMSREMPAYQKVCQIPLPSFAGKDEALFAFIR